MPRLAFHIEADYEKVIKLREEIAKLKSEMSGMDGNTAPATLRTMEVQLAKNTKEFDALIVSAAKAGNEMEQNFKKKIFDASKAVNTFSDKIIDQKAVIRDVESDVKNLATAYSKMNSLDPNRGKMFSELNALRKALSEEKATLFGLQQEQSKSRLSVKRLRDEYALYNNEGKGVQLTNDGMSVSFGKILGVIGGVGVLKELASEITTVTGQFQRFENVLTNALGGDNNKAKTYLGDIADFAAKTNFQLDELTDNFLKFVNRGVTPTMDSMTKLGDFTNSVSKPYAQLSEAILDINNPERWKEFGVQVQTNGSKVNLTFRGMKIEADRTVESVMNAIEQFGSMDGIKGSTEAIAGTIEGQMSNLKDTITSTLNEIGQANSDVISGGISMSSGLIQNYDKIGRALAGLVATYGVYRTALILSAVLEDGLNKAIWSKITATKAATVAQATYNKVLMMNPWVAFGAIVVSVGLAMWALSKNTTEAEKAQKRFNDAVDESEKGVLSEQRGLAKLKGELAATTKGTDEYNKIRDQIVSKYGKYKEGLQNEIDKVGLLDETYQSLTESIKQSFNARQYDKFKQEQETALDEVMSNNLGKIQDRLYKDLGDEEGSRVYAKIHLALLEGKELDKEIKATLDEVQDKGTVLADSRIDSYIKNIRNAQQATDEFDKKARDKFGIDGSNEDERGKGNTKELSTISDEIDTATKKVSTLKQELSDLRSGKTSAEAGKTVKDTIDAKLTELKAAEDALSTLTGQTTKETDKLLKTQSDLSRAILESELKLQASRIAIMQEGKDKRVLLADQEYKETLAAIEKEREEYKKGVKDSGGKEDSSVLSTFDNRGTAAEGKRNTDVALINKDYEKEYTEHSKTLTDVFLNEEQRKLSAIKDRYDKERKWADEQLATGGMDEDKHKKFTATIDQAEMKENYNSLLAGLNDYKQQEAELRATWQIRIDEVEKTGDIELSERMKAGRDKALSSLTSQMLQESSEWMRLFGNLDTLTVDELNKLIYSIQAQVDSGNIKMNPVDMKAFMDSLNDAKNEVAKKSPFTALAKSSGEMKKALADLKKAEDTGLSGEQLDVYKKKVKDSAENVKKSIEAIGSAYGQVSDVMKSAGELVGMIDEGLGETVNNAIALGDAVMNVGEVVANAVIAFAAGMSAMETASVILLVIKAVIMAVMAAMALFNGDKKHEKKIKGLQDQVENLEKAYNRLGRTIENTYSDKVYALMDQQEENLRKQQELIRQQIREEEAKKKTDKDKVKDWKEELDDIDNQIEDSNRKQIEMWAGTDALSAIDAYADAMVDAYAQGEDAAKAMADTTKKLLANAVKEALKKKFLADALQGAVTQLGKDMEDGNLSDMDKKRFEDSTNAAGERFTEAMKMYDDLFKDTENEIKDGVSGQLQAAMTEGTASQLVGLWNSTAIDMRELKNLTIEQRDSVKSVMADVKEIVKQNYLIEQNTRRGADNTDGLIDELKTGFETLDKRLGTIEKNTKSYNGRG